MPLTRKADRRRSKAKPLARLIPRSPENDPSSGHPDPIYSLGPSIKGDQKMGGLVAGGEKGAAGRGAELLTLRNVRNGAERSDIEAAARRVGDLPVAVGGGRSFLGLGHQRCALMGQRPAGATETHRPSKSPQETP